MSLQCEKSMQFILVDFKHVSTFVHICSTVSSNRYDNTGGGAIEVISPAGSPVQPQQEKPEEGQQQSGMGTSMPHLQNK